MFLDETVTLRLRFRILSRAVVDPLNAYNHPATLRLDTVEGETRLATWGSHETPEETLEFLERAEEGHESVENAACAVFPRDGEDGAGESVGTAGFNSERDKRRAVFGMWSRKESWDRGYSGERAAAFFAAAFDVLGLDVASVYAMPENEASCRVIEKYTGRFGGGEDGLFPNKTVNADDIPCDVRG